MRRIIVAAWACTLAACGSQSEAGDEPTPAASTSTAASASTEPAAGLPDLAACPAREAVDEEMRARTAPIPVPPVLREVMRSDMNNFALVTLEGATVCVDASWFEGIREPALSADKRFASFDWDGYESYGHVIVDRDGKGVVVDTGTPPVASPSGKLLAAADLSESGFGALNAFAVWQADGLRQLAKHEDASQVTDWRIDRWAGEDCIELSAVRWEDTTGEGGEPRQPYSARRSNGWRLEPGHCPGT
jgi:hypothetical protein